ncbi:hypothetical protein GT755_30255 [Herbidospora sp. NEAU-GS84]|uniref:GNAT family N-acetyltransferase n=1 Tax=Herbidospora solisilvae TaxID=2696284 RepID=A0A7C9J6G2_9ACTN|nr:hypothetical protein [Herbidospora solisilvae]NAS25947.1 hypothetical protein [Herbidospora solisilvae]
MAEEAIEIRHLGGRAREFTAASAAWLDRRGLRATLRWDMAGWAGHLTSAPLADGVNPTFDPRHSRLTGGDAFWIAVREHSGEISGCVAMRLLVTPDLLRLAESLRLWYDPVPDVFGEVRLRRLPHDELISGRVAHAGGLWVRPARRGGMLAYLLVHLARLLAVDRFDSGWETSVTFDKLALKPRFRAVHGFDHVVPLLQGFFPPTGRIERIHLNYSRPRRILDILPSCIETLSADGVMTCHDH